MDDRASKIKALAAAYGEHEWFTDEALERAIWALLNEEIARRDAMIRELRMTLGLFGGALPVTPQEAWEVALRSVAEHVEFARVVCRDFPEVFGRCWNA